MASIKAIDGRSVHQLQSGQVIVDLCSVVKELVENSLDAGATTIDVRFSSHGFDGIEVQDNGSGVAASDYDSLALKHYTSKLSSYTELDSVTTFGFRGEALSSLSALAKLSIVTTQHDEAPKGVRLEFEHSGKLRSSSLVASPQGTTVIVNDLFGSLPVRRRDLEKNIKREYGRVLGLLHAYACVSVGVRFTVTNNPAKGKKVVVFSTKSNSTTRENIANIYGVKAIASIIPLELDMEMQSNAPNQTQVKSRVKIDCFISKPIHGEGRQHSDRQMFFVNSRPCNLPQISRVFNDVYKSYNLAQSPFIFANLKLDTRTYDVNVSPDKRTIMLHDQALLLEKLKAALFDVLETQSQSTPRSQLLENFPSALRRGESLMTLQPESGATFHAKYASTSEMDRFDSAAGDRIGDSMDAEQEIFVEPSNESETSNLPSLQAYVKREPLSEPREGISESDAHLNPPAKTFTSEMTAQRGNTTNQLENVRNEHDDAIGFVARISYRERDRSSAMPVSDRKPTTNSRTVVSTIQSAKRRRIDESGRILSRLEHDSPDVLEPDTPVFLRSTNSNQSDQRHPDGSETLEMFDNGRQALETSTGLLNQSIKQESPNPANVGTHLSIEDAVEKEEQRRRQVEEARVQELLNRAESATRSPSVSSIGDAVSGPTLDATRNSTVKLARKVSVDVWHLKKQHLRLKESLAKECESHQTNETALAGRTSMETLSRTQEQGSVVITKSDFQHMRIVGQFNLGFILAVRAGQAGSRLATNTSDSDLFIIDQHASDEIHNFHRLSQTITLVPQPLVQPRILNLTAIEEEIAIMHQDHSLAQNGFTFEVDLSGNKPVGSRLSLKSLPTSGGTTFTVGDFEELLAILKDVPEPEQAVTVVEADVNETTESNARPVRAPSEVNIFRPSRVRRILAMRACRSSIMIGKSLDESTMTRVVRNMGKMERPWNCPHGRPTMRHLCALDRMFTNANEVNSG